MKADSLDHALHLAVEARDARRPLSIGVLGNAAELLPRLLAMGAPIDIVTDQTSAHDPLAYLPLGLDFEDMADAAAKDPAGFTTRARESMARHVEAMVGFMDAGAEVFDYGNSIRGEARLAGYDRAFAFPGFVPAYIRPLFSRGQGPLPLGRAVRRGLRHREDRQGDPRPLPGERVPGPLDPHGGGAGPLPGPARPYLLAGLRRAGQGR
ncbi:Urocanate hydratase [Streptomyces purpurascens]